MKAVICKFGLGATVYELWKCSNAVLHQGCPSSEEQIITSIKKQVKMRLEFKGSFPCTKENREICCKWGLSTDFLRSCRPSV